MFSRDPDWVTFYREVMGLHGVVRRYYTTRQSMAEFEQTEVYLEIQQMLTKLRRQGPPAKDPEEPTRVITVRLPKSLHETLRVDSVGREKRLLARRENLFGLAVVDHRRCHQADP